MSNKIQIAKLSDRNIELVEDFIYNNTPYLFSQLNLNDQDIYNMNIAFSEIEDLPITSYIYFGSNAYGMTSYGFYKTKNNKIYIVEAYCNNLMSYYEPTELLNTQIQP